MKKIKNRGFTLIELSIVLIIISILIFGVISGRTQIKKAQFNAIMQEFIVHREMVELFRTQYNYYPGDFPRAYSVWGTDCSNSADDCNGNGNGIIDYDQNSKNNVEAFRAWQHMSLSGISASDLPGIANVNGEANYKFNVPQSNSIDAGWTFDIGTYIDKNNPGFGTQVLRLGQFKSGRNLLGGFMTSIDSFLFNEKFDNGVANTGGITYYCYNSFQINGCYNGIVKYDLEDNSLVCFFEFAIRNDITLDHSPC